MQTNAGDARTLLSTVCTVLTVLVVVGLAIQPASAAATSHSESGSSSGPASAPESASHPGSAPDPESATASYPTLADLAAVSPGAPLADDGTGLAPSVRIDVQDDVPQVTLEDAVRRQERGDIVALNFTFGGGAAEARVTLGSAEDLNFEVAFSIRDGDGDGSVVVLWNTAESDDSDAGLTVRSDSAGPGADAFVEGPTVVHGVSEPVEPAGYPVSVVTSATDNETALGTVFVEERSTEDLTVHTAPANHSSFETVSGVESAASSAAAGETIAVDDRARDWVVLRLSASGLSNSIDEMGDLLDDSDHVTLEIAQDEASFGTNEEPVDVSLDGNATLLEDETHDVYYVVFDPSVLLDASADVGDRFVANFTVDAAHELAETNESVSATFTLVEGQASFDLQDGQLLVEATESATVNGTSTWAPGTNLLVHLRSSDTADGATPFTVQNDSVVVADDGTWSTTFDLTEQSEGQRIDALVFHAHSSFKLANASGELR